MSRKITFFSFKDYEEPYIVDAINAYDEATRIQYEFVVAPLSMQTVDQAEGSVGVCVFVHDDVNEDVVRRLHALGIRLILCRCAGFN
jgi:D-lactate dehydrogenase